MAQDGMIGLFVIGGSAGSLEVLLELVPGLHPGIPFPIIVVTHRNSAESMLAELLGNRTRLPVHEAEDKEELKAGTMYLAPSGYHLLVETDGTVSLDCSEKVNWSRPSIDVTFETAVEAYGSRVAGLLLSGANHDGVDGLEAIQRFGGRTYVQDPKTAQVGYMPQGAIDRFTPDKILAPSAMAQAINALGGFTTANSAVHPD